MSFKEQWTEILALIDPPTKRMVLISLVAVAHAVVLATIPILPAEHRIYGFVAFACLLVATLIGTVVVLVRPKSGEQPHDHLSENHQSDEELNR